MPGRLIFAVVKFFAFIMAVIVLIQSCMPCTDCFAMKPGNDRAVITSSHGHQGTQDDWCSPFCLCSCCAGFAFTAYSVPLIIPVSAVCVRHSAFYHSSIRSVSLPVWQPPQLVA